MIVSLLCIENQTVFIQILTSILIRLIIIGLLFLPIVGKAAIYPIRLIDGLLVSEATIEGKSVDVIFDSGAPGLVLNSKYYSAAPHQESQPCIGINGNFECYTYEVKHWSWLEVQHKRTTALLSDLSFLEKSLGKEIHGLVGLSVLSDYYVSIDFDMMTVSLTKKIQLDKNQVLHFQYVGELPVITCEVNQEKKIFGLDTGSEINYLFNLTPIQKQTLLADALPIMVIGTENKKDLKYSAHLSVNLNDLEYFSNFIIDPEKETRFRHDAFDGFLGLEFLDQFNIVIHPGKQILMLTPRTESGNTTLTSSLSMQ